MIARRPPVPVRKELGGDLKVQRGRKLVVPVIEASFEVGANFSKVTRFGLLFQLTRFKKVLVPCVFLDAYDLHFFSVEGLVVRDGGNGVAGYGKV